MSFLASQKEPHRHPRVAARWALRYLEEDGEADDRGGGLCGFLLTGNGYPEASQALRDMTEKATRRRKCRGVA
jgi:hypothetical protein